MTIRAYRRISVDKQESQSLDQQAHLINRWAEYKHAGELLEWYTDPGVSGGKKLSERTDGTRLLRDLRKGDTLAVIKIDRLARSVRDLLDVIEDCETVGAKFVATEQDVSTEGAYGRFMLTLLGALAELERGIVSERTKAARAQFLRDGRYGVGRLPYGFHAKYDPDVGWLRVRPHPEQGPRLREAVLNVINGSTQASQAESLGLPEPTFRGLLINTRLYGLTPGEGGKLDPDAGIISASEWQALQARVGGPRSWSRADGYGPVLECYRCERRMYLDTHNNYYRCEAKHSGRPTIRRPQTDEYVEEWFLGRYGAAPVLRLEWDNDADANNELRERLATVEIELEAAGKAITAPGADVVALAEDVARLQQQRKDLLAEPAPPRSVKVVPTGRKMAEHWETLSYTERCETLTHFLREDGAVGVKFVINPASAPGGRIEPVVSEWSPEDLEWLIEQGLEPAAQTGPPTHEP